MHGSRKSKKDVQALCAPTYMGMITPRLQNSLQVPGCGAGSTASKSQSGDLLCSCLTSRRGLAGHSLSSCSVASGQLLSSSTAHSA